MIEFHVLNSGWRVSVNPEAITQVSDLEGHAEIVRSDGGDVEVRETYENVLSQIKGEKL